ncbi:T9SS type A sorting domain-containing protein, partial [candidate division KSB1 bacterium]|nr:T9SS type A sorting domain-containing protein [candidate division KSB1 bacterium]
DLVGAADLGNALKWWENDGQQNWVGHTLAGDVNGARAIYPADVNLDGYIDVLAAVWWDDDILLFYNDGFQNFSRELLDGDFDGAHAILALDLDGDADIDIVAGAYKYANGDIKWYENRIFALSADADGNRKEIFGATEPVYGRTTGLGLADGVYPLYVVRHYHGWDSRLDQPIPPRVDFPGTFNDPLTEITLHNGNIGLADSRPAPIWPAPPGEIDLFDIVVDINRDGDYDPPIDLLDADFYVPFGFSLPVRLSRFSAERQIEGVLLSWQTESETNNVGFEIEMREDENEAYSMLASYRHFPELVGAGQSDRPLSYAFLHHRPPAAPTLYYRLVQVGVDGQRHAFQPLEIYAVEETETATPELFRLHPVYPNPFNHRTTAAITIGQESDIEMQLIDVSGRSVRQFGGMRLPAGLHRLPVNADGLPSGLYFLHVRAGAQQSVAKLLLLR